MSRIPNRLLEHRVVIRAVDAIGTSVGDTFADAVTRRAITVDKRSVVRDQRASSDTSGDEILAQCHILLQPEHIVPPGSLVTVWPGTPLEAEREVVATALGQHSIAPSSAQLWLV